MYSNTKEKHNIMGWRSKARRAKKLHRPSLKGDWERDDLYDKFPSYLEKLKEENSVNDNINNNGIDYKETHNGYCRECIYCNTNDKFPAKINFDNVSPNEFIERYERKRIPCVITGVTTSTSWGNHPWKADKYWKLDELEDNHSLKRYRLVSKIV